jgi:aminodeoxychorismate lyase
MIVFLNGELVPQEQATVSVLDRGFLYGDGLFETLLVLSGKPFRWRQHLERLHRGADFLKIQVPFQPDDLRRFLDELIAANGMPHAVLRLTLSRGTGPRGYSPRGADQPVLVMTLHPAPPFAPNPPARWRLVTATCRLPAHEPLAQFKTCNKLPQIIGRSQADAADAHEALLLNTNGAVVEAAGSNLFWIQKGTPVTPPVASGVLPGVTRTVVFEICQTIGLSIREDSITRKQLLQVEGIFLSLSSAGIVEAVSLDGQLLGQSSLTGKIRDAYNLLLRSETGGATTTG